MTFTDIVTEICTRLNYTSAAATARVGSAVNRKYKLLTASLGVDRFTRRTQVQSTIVQGMSTLTFSGVTKISNVIDKSSGQDIVLPEVSIEEMRRRGSTNTKPQCHAILTENASTVTIQLDCVAQTAFTLYADGTAQLATLSGMMVPLFDEDFHEILIEAVLIDEYRKLEKPGLAQVSKELYDEYLSALKFHLQKSAYSDLTIKKSNPYPFVAGAASGGGSAPNGATSWTQTGLVTFDRTGQPPGSRAPFAVVAGSEKVANLDADKLDGLDSTAFRLVSVQITESDITLADVASDNVSSAAHGFAPKSPADATKFLNGAATPAYAQVKDSDLSTSDIVTNDVSTAKHGFAPKAPNDVTKFLRGDATYATLSNICAAVTSTGTVNNLAPGLVSGVLNIVPVNNATDLTLTGLSSSGIAAGTRARFISTGAGNVFFKYLNGGSSAANQFKNFATSGDTPISKGVAEYEFDGTNWVLHVHEQGAWITPAFAAGDYAGAAGWTVGSGDVTAARYMLRGRTLHYAVQVTTTTVTGGANILQRTLFGFTAQTGAYSLGMCGYNDNGTGFQGGGWSQVNSAATVIQFLKRDLSNWAAATDNTSVSASGVIEVA